MSAIALDGAADPVVQSSVRRWTGRILLGIAVLFLSFDTAIHLAGIKAVVESSAQLGFSPDKMFTIGVIELICLIVYLIPRTAPIGAVLFTGYLGGAIVTHFRVDSPLLTHTLFPIYLAAMLWGALYLRDPRVRAVIRPIR